MAAQLGIVRDGGLVCDGDEGGGGVGGGENDFGALPARGGDADAEAGNAGGVGNDHKKKSPCPMV